MDKSKRILAAIDDSKSSRDAVAYLAAMINGRKEFQICLFHVLPPLPPQLLEFGGAEDPKLEHRLDLQLRDVQEQWIATQKRQAGRVVTEAKSILQKAGSPLDTVQMHFYLLRNGEEMVDAILDFARRKRYGVIVLGRESFSGINQYARHHVADDLIRKGKGFSIWVVQ